MYKTIFKDDYKGVFSAKRQKIEPVTISKTVNTSENIKHQQQRRESVDQYILWGKNLRFPVTQSQSNMLHYIKPAHFNAFSKSHRSKFKKWALCIVLYFSTHWQIHPSWWYSVNTVYSHILIFQWIYHVSHGQRRRRIGDRKAGVHQVIYYPVGIVICYISFM